MIDLATKECLSKGITSFEDAGSPFSTVDTFRVMAEKHELGLRLWGDATRAEYAQLGG